MEVSDKLTCTHCFSPEESALGTHEIRGWVGRRARLDAVECRKILSSTRIKLRFAGCLTCTLITYSLSCVGSDYVNDVTNVFLSPLTRLNLPPLVDERDLLENAFADWPSIRNVYISLHPCCLRAIVHSKRPTSNGCASGCVIRTTYSHQEYAGI